MKRIEIVCFSYVTDLCVSEFRYSKDLDKSFYRLKKKEHMNRKKKEKLFLVKKKR